MALGADLYIVKPTEPYVILEKAQSLIHQVTNKNYKPKRPAIHNNNEYFKEYNERLFSKMENKILELEQSEQKYRALFECAADAIVTFNTNLTIATLNPAATKMFGYGISEIAGLKESVFVPAEKLAEFNAGIKLFGTDNAIQNYETVRVRKNGEQFPAEISLSELRTSNGNVFGYSEIIRDITARKKIESQLKISESKLAKVISTSLSGIAISDENGFLTTWNKKMQEITGISENETIGFPVWDIHNRMTSKYSENSSEYNQLKKGILDALHSGILAYGNIKMERPYVTPSGKMKTVEGSVFLVETENNCIYVSILDDITDKRLHDKELLDLNESLEYRIIERTAKLEENTKQLSESQKALTFLVEDITESRAELEVTNKKLQTLNNELESFAYFVSHDLKAPLRIITGFSEILLTDFSKDFTDPAKDYINRIVVNANKMSLLISDLLEFAQIGRKKPIIEEIEVGKLVTEVFTELLTQESYRKIQFIVSELPNLNADYRLFKQCIINIISNSIKYTRPIENAVIEVGYTLNHGKCEYFVRDNGVGFDMKHADKLFNVFQRMHNDRDFEGTGIGLALVKKIISRHNGSVRIDSKINSGTVVYFSL